VKGQHTANRRSQANSRTGGQSPSPEACECQRDAYEEAKGDPYDRSERQVGTGAIRSD
jgi:hypothetical protein